MSKEREQEGLSIKVPLITEEEIRYMDNNMETIVNTFTKQMLEIVILKDYISKFIIKETLEELQTEYKIALEENSIKAFILKCKIESLEELLKDGGK